MITSSNTIYTIQTDATNLSQHVEIETVVTKGLYRFTLLGMNSKQASDTKDRVYAALRSSGLLNLKSDNRKIIVNLHPDNTYKKEGFYDLGIALSCIASIEKKIYSKNMLVVGGLSISGKIVPTQRISQTIYTAYTNNIGLVLCSTTDALSLGDGMIEKLYSYGIEIIHADNLRDLVFNIEKYANIEVDENADIHRKKVLPYIPNKNLTYPTDIKRLSSMNVVQSALYIGLCGGHNTLVETTSHTMFKKTYESLYTYKPEVHTGRDMYTRCFYKLLDSDSCHHVVYIENIKAKDYTPIIQSAQDSIVGTYTSCSCGYQFNFFEPHSQDKRCICSKRSIIQHKRHIENMYFQYFSIKVNHIQQPVFDAVDTTSMHTYIDIVRKIQYNRYMLKHRLNDTESFFFKDNAYLNEYIFPSELTGNLSVEAKTVWLESGQDGRCLKVAQTIEDILELEENIEGSGIIDDMYTKEKPAISKRALLLALSYLPKMDF